MSVAVLGAGAFGTALAVSLAHEGGQIGLWARDAATVAHMRDHGEAPRLPGVELPANIAVNANLETVCAADTLLLAVPAQALRGFVAEHAALLDGKALVACCKGVDLMTLTGPVGAIRASLPEASPAILTGPSFAADIARGLPTALTLACADPALGAALQAQLSTANLRLYRTTDVTGAELGGALKNVMAIACGAAMGAGFGESARAAVLTRGFAEMQRLAAAMGAQPETLAGLSGFGDLVLTSTSEQSRNYRYGLALGRGEGFDPTTTVEGVSTAKAVSNLAKSLEIDLPITTAVAALIGGKLTVTEAMKALLARPLKEE